MLWPLESDPFKIRMQLYQGLGTSPQFQEGVAWMVLWYILVVVEGFDGTQKIACAEWNTLTWFV